MTNLDRKIQEIADGYAMLTHKPKGWEGGASLTDYLTLREQAIKESGLAFMPLHEEPAPLPSTKSVEVRESPMNYIPAQSKEEAHAPIQNESVKVEPANPTNTEKPRDALAILKSLGA